MLYAYVSLSYPRLYHAWRPSRAWSCLVTSNAHEALFRCNHLTCVSECRVASCIPLPFSAPCDDMFAMLVRATHWLSMHLYMLANMFMHKSCLLVCRPYFNTMKIWTLDPNPWTPPFVCFLACLPSHLFASFLVSLLAMSIMLICFMPLSYALCIFSFHCLSAGFLYLSLHMERGHMELGHGFPSSSKKKGEDASMWI